VIVVASDNSQSERNATAMVMVTVLDINDNAPVLSPFQNVSILETVPLGTLLTTFQASDR